MNQTDQDILLRQDTNSGITTLTLNRPQQRNALSVALMTALQDEFDAIKDDRSVRVVILAANGPAFCAGHDLKELRANANRKFYEALFTQCSRLMTSIVALPQPVIAQVHSIATAAGCQLVATCDLAVASDVALFATPGVNIGLFCSTPMVALSRNVARKHAMEMLLTGDMLPAKDALAYGLINKVVTPKTLDEAVIGYATSIANKSALTIAYGKEAFYRQAEMPLQDAYRYAGEVMTKNMLAHDAEEGIDAFLERRDPAWTGT
jgi:enoyl-CoA hydratase/carnithine racemase